MNLVNDPLFDPNNEYNQLIELHKIDYSLVVPYSFQGGEELTDEDLIKYEKHWKQQVGLKYKEELKKVTDELNASKTFYFGCPFEIYKSNYHNRIEQYCIKFPDADDSTFVDSEIDFLVTILKDYKDYIRNNLNYIDDNLLEEQKENRFFVFQIILVLGYDTYFIYHKQKIEFLNNIKKQTIKDFFVEKINTYISHLDDKNFIPDILKHENIIRNINTKNALHILDYYYRINTRLDIDNLYNTYKTKYNYFGSRNALVYPYNIVYNGVYLSINDFITLTRYENILYKNIRIKFYYSLQPFLDEYCIGFSNGYTDFENDIIKPVTNIFTEDSAKIHRIFSFITDGFQSRGFTFDGISNSIVDVYKTGLQNGYKYNAWSIMLSNPTLFEPLFEKFYIDNNINIDKQQSQDKNLSNKTENTSKPQKLSEKWYALLYIIELKIKGEKPPMTNEDKFDRKELTKIGVERCNSKGQSFYKEVKDNWKDNIDNNFIKRSFGDHWKDKIKNLSNNNSDIIDFLKNI